MFITFSGKHGLKNKINVTGSTNRVKTKKNKKLTRSLPNYTLAHSVTSIRLGGSGPSVESYLFVGRRGPFYPSVIGRTCPFCKEKQNKTFQKRCERCDQGAVVFVGINIAYLAGRAGCRDAFKDTVDIVLVVCQTVIIIIIIIIGAIVFAI